MAAHRVEKGGCRSSQAGVKVQYTRGEAGAHASPAGGWGDIAHGVRGELSNKENCVCGGGEYMLYGETGCCCWCCSNVATVGAARQPPHRRSPQEAWAAANRAAVEGGAAGAAQYASYTAHITDRKLLLDKMLLQNGGALPSDAVREVLSARCTDGRGRGKPANSGTCGVLRSRTLTNFTTWPQAGLRREAGSPQQGAILGTHLIPCEHCLARLQGLAPRCK